MNRELHAVSIDGAAILRGREVIVTRWIMPSAPYRAMLTLPDECGEVVALGITNGAVSVLDERGVLFTCGERWSRLGEVGPPEPTVAAGPAPGSRGVLQEPAPRDGSTQPLVRCRALSGFAVGGGIDCVAGDEIEISFARALNLSRLSRPLVEIIDLRGFSKLQQAAEAREAAQR